MNTHFLKLLARAGILRSILIILTIAASGRLNAQKIITLKECYEAAVSSSSLSAEKNSYNEISSLKESNIRKGWLPAMDVNASLLYNSSVVDLSSALGSLPFPGIADAISPLPHDQYKVTVDINQTLYDGGAIKGARELEKAELKVNQKQTEADIYKIRSQVNSVYFSLLMLDKQKELLTDYLDLIVKKISSVSSAVENGVLLKSDIDILNSERLRINQELSENEIKKTAYTRVLSMLTGLNIESSAELALPVTAVVSETEINRPELQLFDLKKEQLSAGNALVQSKRMPKAFGFATLGYGNPPGNNFFRDEFDTYYIVGAGLKWNFLDWNKSKNEKKVIEIQKTIIENRKTDMTDNLKRQLESKMAEIEGLEKMIETDNELINIRKRVTAAEESRHQNGTITATDYLNALNAERQAMINAGIHKISLEMAKIEYLNISGKDQ